MATDSNFNFLFLFYLQAYTLLSTVCVFTMAATFSPSAPKAAALVNHEEPFHQADGNYS